MASASSRSRYGRGPAPRPQPGGAPWPHQDVAKKGWCALVTNPGLIFLADLRRSASSDDAEERRIPSRDVAGAIVTKPRR